MEIKKQGSSRFVTDISADTTLLQRYAALLRNMYDELFEFNISKDTYRIIFYTPDKYAIPAVVGKMSTTLADMSDSMIFPEDNERYTAFFNIERIRKEFATGNKSLVFDFRKLKTNGEYSWAQALLIDATKDDEEVWLSYLLDIDERKQNELKIQEVSEQFLKTFGTIYHTIVEVDLATNKTRVIKDNLKREMEKKIFLDDELVKVFADNAIYSEHRQIFKNAFNIHELRRLAKKERNQKTIEVQCLTADNHYEWIEVTAYVVGSGENTKVIGTMRNINNQKFLKSIVDKFVYDNCDCFIFLDTEHDTYTMYSGNRDETSLPPDNSCYSYEVEKYTKEFVAPEDIERVLEGVSIPYVLHELEKSDEYILYYGLIEKSGYRRKKQSFVYFDRPKGHILLTRTDVTHLYNEEAKKKELLASALKQAEMASFAKSEFLSRMSHDIRTPMNAIMGMASIALSKIGNNHQVKDCLNKINISSNYLLSIINEVLDMSRIESGMMFLSEKHFDFKELIHNLSTIIKPQAGNKNISFEIKVNEPVSDHYVGDLLRINQILINILSNSVKFTLPGGYISIDIKEKCRVDNRAVLLFTLSDTGCGISKEFMKKMYEPFEQENVDVGRNQSGSGLGLSIVYNLVKLMGGVLSVESTQGVGTTFTLELTLGIGTDREMLNNNEESMAFTEIPLFSHQRILLVEDNEINMDIAKTLLEEGNLTIETAENGKIALEKFISAPSGYYDAILMDIRMPVMDGLEATKAIRSSNLEYAVTVPIIAMSANAFRDDIDLAINVGMNYYLVKPLDMKKMFTVINRVMSKQ